jgi:hypothetical protein
VLLLVAGKRIDSCLPAEADSRWGRAVVQALIPLLRKFAAIPFFVLSAKVCPEKCEVSGGTKLDLKWIK